MDVIWVRSGTPGDLVALWERAPEHPDGEVFVAGAAPVLVAITQAVAVRLRDGRLIYDTGQAPDVSHDPAAEVVSAAARRGSEKQSAPSRRGRRV